MKIAILGTRGIPNHYGGFEQFAEYLSIGLQKKGYSVMVYNSHGHPYKEDNYQGVDLIHKYDPENRIGTVGQFIYDLNCIRDSRYRGFDIVLQLGYTSSSIWNFLLPAKSIIITNMDGMEWKRSKYNKATRRFLKYAEKLAIKSSDFLVADSIGIQSYLQKTYSVNSTYIPYGATIFNKPREESLRKFEIKKHEYDMLIARLEPENNIEVILDGVVRSKSSKPFLVVGNHLSKFGEKMKEKFKSDLRIRFVGGIYDMDLLNNLRYFSDLYYHGHSVGGTNPSLLEAMSSAALICAHRNEFNSSIMGEDAYYFEDASSVEKVRDTIVKSTPSNVNKVEANCKKIQQKYTWDIIIDQYEQLFLESYQKNK